MATFFSKRALSDIKNVKKKKNVTPSYINGIRSGRGSKIDFWQLGTNVKGSKEGKSPYFYRQYGTNFLRRGAQ